MYVSFAEIQLIFIGALLGYVIVKGREHRYAERLTAELDAQHAKRAQASSPHRIPCPRCGAPPHTPCTTVDGIDPWDAHPERYAAIRELRKAEIDAEHATLRDRAHTRS